MSTDDWIRPTDPQPLDGSEMFTGTDATVAQFWAYAMRDLRTNTTRGFLAEFLVAKAVGATGVQPEWNSFDVLTPDGVKVEVKSSAYLQSWAQRTLTPPVFNRLTARSWAFEDGEAEERSHNADVYVLALQAVQSHDEYDPLDTLQWEFYVLPVSTLAARGYRSITLNALRKIAEPVAFAGLAAAIRDAAN